MPQKRPDWFATLTEKRQSVNEQHKSGSWKVTVEILILTMHLGQVDLATLMKTVWTNWFTTIRVNPHGCLDRPWSVITPLFREISRKWENFKNLDHEYLTFPRRLGIQVTKINEFRLLHLYSFAINLLHSNINLSFPGSQKVIRNGAYM